MTATHSSDGAASDDSASSPEATALLVARCRTGDEAAAAMLFSRYIDRLSALLRERIAARFAPRFDAEDVAMSAFRSVLVGLRQGAFAIEQRGDLWRLIAEVSLHKLFRRVEEHSAARRSPLREKGLLADHVTPLAANQPSPEHIAAAVDLFEDLLKRLRPLDRQVLDLRLQGANFKQIAAELGCNERTARRSVQRARETLEAYGLEFAEEQPTNGAAATEEPPTATFTPSSLQRFDFNRLKLRRQAGAGAFGKVYLADNAAGGPPLAVKFLRKRYWKRALVVERFVAEADLLSRLEHPQITRFHGFGTTPAGGLFFVMDWINGVDLGAVSAKQRFSIAEAVGCIRQVAEVVAYAHERGVIHCDLKPSNLLLAADGVVHVTDFGFAQVALQQHTAAIGGTPAFMAPEQIDGSFGPVNYQTDVWGLGAVLYYLLTGRPPQTAFSTRQTIEQLLNAEPVLDVRRIAPETPDTLAQLCMACLNKSRTQRPESAAVLGQTLEAIQDARA